MLSLSSLVVLTPMKQSPDHNLVRIHREYELDSERLLHIAGGEHTGIIIYKPSPSKIDDDFQMELSFAVWLTNGQERKQEKRTLRFWTTHGVTDNVGRVAAHKFFMNLLVNMPKDYTSFMKRILKQLQTGFPEIQSVELDMKFASEEEMVAIPDATQYESSSEVEEVTAGHIQEILEHAYPNGLPLSAMAEALRCTEDEVIALLRELEENGIVRRVDDEWIRVDVRNVEGAVRSQRAPSSAEKPTVAIITCLFVEKQAVDALIQDPEVIHKYKSGGDSNVYTLGRIGNHRVVATKLAMIGDSREATTSAGSITTRLLGNFQDIEHVFVVGVGGAVPHYTDAKLHARLGDVIVSANRPSSYIYAHDLIVDRNDETLAGFAVRMYKSPSDVVERIIEEGGDHLNSEWEETTNSAIGALNQNDTDFSRPPPDTDVLALSVGGGNVVVVPHPNQDRKNSLIHLGTVGALASLKRGKEELAEDDESHSQIRERFASDYSIRALDAGFDSVVASIVGSRIDSWALIRGVADYQQGLSRSAKVWQAHAAARAASLTRLIVEKLPPVN